MVTAQWPLDLFRRASRIEVRDREVEASEQTVADRQRTLVADVRERYGQAAAAVREVAVTDNIAVSTRRQYRSARPTCRRRRLAAARPRRF